MSRTQARLDSDLGYADGQIDLSAGDFKATTGTPVLTLSSAGVLFQAVATGGASVLVCPLSKLLFRMGLQDLTWNAFGSSIGFTGPDGRLFGSPSTVTTIAINANPGIQSSIPVSNSGLFIPGQYAAIDTGANYEVVRIVSVPTATSIQIFNLQKPHASGVPVRQNIFRTPAGPSGPPPFVGASQFAAVTSRPKGIMFRGLELRYLIAGGALSVNTIGLTQTLFLDNAATPTVNNILAQATNGLLVAARAGMYVTPVAFPTPAQYQTADLAEYMLQWSMTTGAGTANIYGATLYVTYNFN